MFDDGRESVKGVLVWTLLAAGSLRLEARNPAQGRLSANFKEATDAPERYA